jgi:hypothetical protein
VNVSVEKLVADFLRVAALAGEPVARHDLEPEVLAAPHRPPTRLRAGKKAAYVFHTGALCLKVGKVGPKSHARFTSQHYNPKGAGSTLARSLLSAHDDLLDSLSQGRVALDEDTVGEWIKQRTTRIHFYLDEDASDALLSLLEAFLRCRLRPVFEGG